MKGLSEMVNIMSKKAVTVDDSKLEITDDGVTTVVLPSSIKQFLEFDQIVIVRIQPKCSSFINENIFGVSYSGKIVWQIAERKYVFARSPYTNISKEGQLLKAHNWDGTDLVIDPQSGNVLKASYSR